VSEAIGRAIDALELLGMAGESVEDEWSYVTELVAAQRDRLAEIDRRRGVQALSETQTTAVDLAIEEAGRIEDPNRAIDWLSTFPDLVALALDEPVGGPVAPGA